MSDQESWLSTGRHGSTDVMTEWQMFVANQVRLHERGWAAPKLVCIDLQPYTTTQAPDRSDILDFGGFSDAVFSVVAAFLTEEGSGSRRFRQLLQSIPKPPSFPVAENVKDFPLPVGQIMAHPQRRGVAAGQE